jgi:hypothetical protein
MAVYSKSTEEPIHIFTSTQKGIAYIIDIERHRHTKEIKSHNLRNKTLFIIIHKGKFTGGSRG